jgi:hypothetical protein
MILLCKKYIVAECKEMKNRHVRTHENLREWTNLEETCKECGASERTDVANYDEDFE